jgi:hypothetical protein
VTTQIFFVTEAKIIAALTAVIASFSPGVLAKVIFIFPQGVVVRLLGHHFHRSWSLLAQRSENFEHRPHFEVVL